MGTRNQHQSGSQYQSRVENHIETVNVVKRQKAENAIRARELCSLRAQELKYVCDKVVVREHYALGQSGGATGIRQRGQSLLGRLTREGQSGSARFQQTGEGFGPRSALASR